MADIEKAKVSLKTVSQGDSPFCEMCGEILEYIEQLEERIAIMQEPVEKKWYPKIRMWECQGCGDVVRGVDKYCSHCGRKFIEEEGEQE